MKPRYVIVAGRPVQVPPADRVSEARCRFGGPFAHESGSKWKPRATPVLTEWLANRKGNGNGR